MDAGVAGKRVVVVGLGVENVPLARYLLKQGAQVTGLDRRPLEQLSGEAQALAASGVTLVAGDDYLRPLREQTFDIVFVTPGMPKTLPEFAEAQQRGARLSGQMDLLFARCRAPIIGVTGSSGKSTTTSLIAHILRAHGERPVYLGGNIGTVLIETVDAIPESAWVVLELSSFQLELLTRSPQIAVLLNLRPNHLDVHGSFDAYAAAKRRILAFQRADAGDLAVVSYDDATARAQAEAAPGKVVYFGVTLPDPLPAGSAGGVTVDGGWIVERPALMGAAPAQGRPVLPVAEIPLRGRHNLGNVMAATAVALRCGVPVDVIRNAVRSFQGLEHRLEQVAVVRRVTFINDSIATAPDRTEAALQTLTAPAILIMGGSDKGISFRPLAQAIAQAPVKRVLLIGAAAARIADDLRHAAGEHDLTLPPLQIVPDLPAAVADAWRHAEPGDTVLLSPACASYDQYPNFMARGAHFKRLVADLAEKE